MKNHRKIEYICLTILLVICLYTNKSVAQNLPETWQQQLEYVKNKTGYSPGDGKYLILTDYIYKGVIVTEADKQSVIDSMLCDEAPTLMFLTPITLRDTVIAPDSCVVHEKIYPNFEIITMRLFKEISRMLQKEDPLIKARALLEELIKTGYEYVELKWNYKGRPYSSLCIVSDKNGGIVYDLVGTHILTNISTTIHSKTKLSE